MFLSLQRILERRLKSAKKVLILGIGSDLRGDDAAGILVADNILKNHSLKKVKLSIAVLKGFTAPENLTGEIKKFKPSHIIIVDAAEMGMKPGQAALIGTDTEEKGASFSTHQLPAKVLIDYLVKSLKCSVILLGIQPNTVKFGAKVSNEIKISTKKISAIIIDSLAGSKKGKK